MIATRWASRSVALVASVAALGVMYWARSAYQVRTLPERILEWVLLFVPLGVFERGIQRLGSEAKVVALYLTLGLMALALVKAGAAAVRRGPAAIGAITLGLWLFGMGVLMPLTGAGFFATDLFEGVLVTNAAYLAAAVTYGAVLLVGARALRERTPAPQSRPFAVSRRTMLGALAGTVCTYALTVAAARAERMRSSRLPMAQIADLPPSPASASSPTPVAAPTSQPGVAAQAPTPAPTPSPIPSPAASPTVALPAAPPPPPSLERTEIGTVAGSARKPSELASLITPNRGFYITTKNPVSDPVIDPARWRLILDGAVARPVQLDLSLLYRLPAIRVTKTLECISNRVTRCGEAPFGCDAIGTAVWTGARLADVLALAGGLKSGVQSLMLIGADEFTASIPPDEGILRDSLLVYQMNGESLPIEHGYPARVLVPNRYGMKGAKWVVNIKARPDSPADWYGQRGWTKEGLVRTMTRIDTPAEGQHLPAGRYRIAGVAYAGTRGISAVEYSIDRGTTWQRAAFLDPPAGPDTWVRWEGGFTFDAGNPVDIAARAVDGAGEPQIEEITQVEPDGQAGLHSITVYPA